MSLILHHIFYFTNIRGDDCREQWPRFPDAPLLKNTNASLAIFQHHFVSRD